MNIYISPEALADLRSWGSTEILPPDIFVSGESPSFKDIAFNYFKGDFEPVKPFDCHLQNITISADLGHFPIEELGRGS